MGQNPSRLGVLTMTIVPLRSALLKGEKVIGTPHPTDSGRLDGLRDRLLPFYGSVLVYHTLRQ